jgi:hypothetical protein
LRAGIFRRAIHGAVGKRPASMPAALRVSGFGPGFISRRIKSQALALALALAGK